MAKNPEFIFVLSGKRKSGKDYIASILNERIGEHLCSLIQLSGPLKKQYAKEHSLDFEKLMDSSSYKEKFRADMIKWGEDKRNKDPEFFCRLATSDEKLNGIWIVTDARRVTDLEFFKQHYGDQAYTVRIVADEDIRQKRGYKFTAGVDDAESECGLDNGVDWNYILENNENEEVLKTDINSLVNIAIKNIRS